MNFKDTINWDAIDANIPNHFFGEHVKRANLVRHGIKNGIITQSRVLGELKGLDAEANLCPNSKYKANVGKKIKWIEEYYFPQCKKELDWFEAKFGDSIRSLAAKRNELLAAKSAVEDGKADKTSVAAAVNKSLGNYPKGISEDGM